MAPKLPSVAAFKAPNAFMGLIARPLSSSAIASQYENAPGRLLNLDVKPQGFSTEKLRGMIHRNSHARVENEIARKRNTFEQLQEKKVSDDYLKHMPRRWNTGDVFAPHDLSPTEMTKWRKVQKPDVDVFDMLGINPLDHYRNFAMISEFMTTFGHIKHAKETGLRPVNHRRISKAIRRAIGMGIHPSVHHHPELLKLRYKTNPNWN